MQNASNVGYTTGMITCMPPRNFTRVASLLLSLLCGAWALASAGCASRGYEKAASTSDAVTTASAQADLALRQIDDTTSALHTLVDRPSTDLKTPLEQYRGRVEA